jgi:hypothetical protein
MGKMKELQILESSIFEVIMNMGYSRQNKNLEEYRLGLAVMDQLNNEYFEITGRYYIPQEKVIVYHSRQWEFI